MHASLVKTHRDYDHAVLWDDFVGELVEGGIWVVIKRFQLLHEVVQLDESSEGLALVRPVHCRGEELQHGVVLTVSLLTNLKGQENGDTLQFKSMYFRNTNTHAGKKEDCSLELPSVLIKPNRQAVC